jgi:hypothetical protein
MANAEHLAQLQRGVEAWNQWRKENHGRPDLNGADLRGADLREANLSAADLRGADLREANLSAADLREADLSGANLGAADVLDTDLTFANLARASLSAADFTGTSLNFADLRGTNLRAACFRWTTFFSTDLTGASIGWTIFANVDLSTARGLKTIKHRGPSTLGIDTLYRSKGNIPEVFLRRAGVPNEMITYSKSLVGCPFEFYSCFISYNHTDKAFARRLHDQLQWQGIRCWLDEHQMRPGDTIYDEIDRGIRLWDKVLLCC